MPGNHAFKLEATTYNTKDQDPSLFSIEFQVFKITREKRGARNGQYPKIREIICKHNHEYLVSSKMHLFLSLKTN